MRKLSLPVLLATTVLSSAALSAAAPGELATAQVQRSGAPLDYVAEGVVEAVRSSVLAAQTSGRVTALMVTAGDRVVAGQVLARIDERLAADRMAASRAQLDAARNEYERSRQLFAKQYISQAAMDQAEAQYKALSAQAASSATQTQFHTITAPYAGVVARVDIEVGDLALPGKPLFAMYAPGVLRATVSVPDSIASELKTDAGAALEVPSAPVGSRRFNAAAIELLPTRDAVAHSAQVRLAIPADVRGVAPGQFVRAQLPLTGGASGTLLIPASAVLHRAEFDAVYVIDKNGKPQLRQVRIGRRDGDKVEALAGLDAGERIALDPLAAAKR